MARHYGRLLWIWERGLHTPRISSWAQATRKSRVLVMFYVGLNKDSVQGIGGEPDVDTILVRE